MSLRPHRVQYAAALLERHDDHFLIARPVASREEERHWAFPRGRVNPGESAEAALRRIIEGDLNLRVEIVVGQPPFLARTGDESVELRYFFCGIISGQARRGPYEELRWVSKAHLREYDFDESSAPVVEWLLER